MSVSMMRGPEASALQDLTCADDKNVQGLVSKGGGSGLDHLLAQDVDLEELCGEAIYLPPINAYEPPDFTTGGCDTPPIPPLFPARPLTVAKTAHPLP